MVLDIVALGGEFGGVFFECVDIDAHTLFLHTDEHVHEWQLDIGIELVHTGVGELGGHEGIQLPEDGCGLNVVGGAVAQDAEGDALEGMAGLGVEEVMDKSMYLRALRS